jgi:hypothetical protein
MPVLECRFTHTSMRVLLRHSRHREDVGWQGPARTGMWKGEGREKKQAMTLHGHVTVWADLLFFETTWFYTTSYAALRCREVLRCSCGVERKDSCTACGRTASPRVTKYRAHSHLSIRAGGEKGTPVHVRTGVSPLHALHPKRSR